MSVTVCTTCHDAPARYRCPACPSNTCSLACSKSHKTTTPCSGQRNRVGFIPRSKFDDASINNDYNFLTALERDLDNAARLSTENVGGRQGNQVRSFVKRAQDVGEVTVLMAPRGMKRSRMNKSTWVAKKAQLSWTVEWLFDGALRKVSDRVLDSTTIRDAVSFYKNKVGETEDAFKDKPLQDLVFLIRNEGVGSAQVSYARLDIDKSVGEALRHRTVVEFPTIHVYVNVPETIRLERQYAFVQPVATKLDKVIDVVPSTTGNDFISFGAEEDESEEEKSVEEEVPATTQNTSLFGLPVLNLDELRVPT